ncbi:MAG TPA: helix-turn-helix transcriptional regulator [Polyangiaceae bacterium]
MPRTISKRTGFDKFFDEQMNSSEFARAYDDARAEIDTIDRFMRELDALREEQKLSKAALARAAGMKPDMVRRLFTAEHPNPTLDTVVRLMTALNRTFAPLVPLEPRRAPGLHSSTLRGVRARNSSPNRRTSA